MIVQSRSERTGVPWRNGLGVQYEIDADRATDWIWRLSTADIDHDVPFSSFPGVHRVFCVGGGSGVTLEVNGREVACGTRSVARFEGGDAVHARIWDGPVHAVNLMWRDGSPWRDLAVLEQGSSRDGVLAVVACGASAVSFGGRVHELDHLDAVIRIDEGCDVSVVRGAVAAVVGLPPRR